MQAGLIGRQADVERVVGWVAEPGDHALGVELVGDPGVGKTAIVAAVLDRLGDGGATAIASIAATPVEQPLTWAGLAQLLDRWPGVDIEGLPSAQRRALDAAVGVGDEPAEPGLVAAAVATLVAAAASRGRAILVVDDAHWIDEATAGAISYAVRANRSRPVRLLIARRPVPAPIEPERFLHSEAFRSLALSGLSIASTYELLAEAGVRLTRPQLVHVHEVSGGNPLHVIEIARQLAAGVALDEALRQTSLVSIIGSRVRSLSPSAITVVGAAGLAAHPTIPMIDASVDGIEVKAALAEAERAGLVVVDGSHVRFVHPTIAAAAAGALGDITRRQLHARLAGVVDDDERALHLDAATDGPDEVVAAALDAAARNALDRGSVALGAQRMRRAVDRTPASQAELAWERRLAAADMYLDAGSAKEADAVLACELPDDVDLVARILRVRGICRFHANDEVGGAGLLESVASMFPPGHPKRVDALLAQARMTVFFDVPASVRIAELAAGEAPSTGDDHLVDATRACALLNRFLAGEPVEFPTVPTEHSRRLTASELLDEVRVWNDDLDTSEPGLVERLADAERRGDVLSVANISQMAAEARMRRGDLLGARTRFERMLELAITMHETGFMGTAQSALAAVNAYLGAGDEAMRHVAALSEIEDGLMPADLLALHGLSGIASALLDDHRQAISSFRSARAVTLAAGLHDCNAMPFRYNMVESLLAVGELDEAREVADELMRFAVHAGRTRGLGDAHRAAALAAAAAGDLPGARASIDQAIELHDRLPGPVEGAWSRLIAGTVERRLRQRAAARVHLEAAATVFRATGCVPLARRADDELARTAVRVGRNDELTPTENQVANLVGLGHTNGEVASMLHLSPKTVEANLTRIYRKLGVRSRTELAARTPGPPAVDSFS